MTKGIASDWIKHLPKEGQKDFESTVRNSTYVLGRLSDIIDEKLASLDREEMSSESYKDPSWAYRQAHVNGERAGLTKIKKLLDF